MLKPVVVRGAVALFVGVCCGDAREVRAAETPASGPYLPHIEPASSEGERAIKRFRVPKEFKVELVAAEPLLANPVAFCIDEQGRFFVAETFRLGAGVTDIRGHMNWLNEDLASRSVEDRVAMLKKHEANRISAYTKESDRVRFLVDTNGDGRVDQATVFADGFNGIPDGLGSGVLARRGDVYYANLPDLWLLRDADGDGVAEARKSLHYGFGVRVGFLGHDLHGLCFGPDGKLYFSVGDRGAHLKLKGGKAVSNPETGAVYRCNPDGSGLEIFAYGLRNPQELAFDNYGNLWTGENNSDGGDPARWVYLVEGGDSGWRIGWQFIERPNRRGPWLAERMCYPDSPVACHLPPIANIANGPSGLAFYPGLGLPERYNEHFFLCDFRGGTGSGVYSFAVRPKGAGFELVDRSEFIWEVLATDGDFGYDGCFYITDWVNGWSKPGKGRIYRVFDPKTTRSRVIAEAGKLMAEGFDHRPVVELVGLLTHPDKRLRQEAQFALARQGAVKPLGQIARVNDLHITRLHGIWGLGQLAAPKSSFLRKAIEELVPLLSDRDAEVRAQTAKVLGEAQATRAWRGLVQLLTDPMERPRFFAAIALGKLRRQEAVAPLIQMLRANDNRDLYLRHAGMMGLAGCADPATLKGLARDPSPAVRLGAVLALRRLARAELAVFLDDPDPGVVLETARAINDLPIEEALPALAAKAGQFAELCRQLDEEQKRVRAVPPETSGAAPAAGEPVDLGAALFRRLVNANFRLGGPTHTAALLGLATNEVIAARLRAEALAALGDWAEPSGRDRVTGLWRPLGTRDPKIASATLQPHLDGLLRGPSPVVQLAVLKAAADLRLASAGAGAFELLSDKAQPTSVRTEALRSLGALKDARLPRAIPMALADSAESLRKEAAKLQAELQPGDALAQLRHVLDTGTTGEKQNALATLGGLTNATAAADDILLPWLDKLLAGQVPPELQVEVLEAAAKQDRPPFQDKLRQFETARPAHDNLRAWRECLTGGDAAEGRTIFLERAEASCVRCHKVNGEGGEVGPDLTGIGARRTREYLLAALVLPNQEIAEGYQTSLVTLKNGTTYAGQVKSETETVLELNSPEDGLLRLNKADVQARERGLSAMPEELRQILTKRDLRDLVEFLSSLK